MKFQAAAQFLAGEADVDPVAAPETILLKHLMRPKSGSPERGISGLYLALIGTGVESVTVDLYFEIADEGELNQNPLRTDKRWFQFATGIVVTNGTLQTVTAGLPAGGTVYARRTADSIAGGQTRSMLMAWV